jgi:hypothetical protein
MSDEFHEEAVAAYLRERGYTVEKPEDEEEQAEQPQEADVQDSETAFATKFRDALVDAQSKWVTLGGSDAA